MVTTNDPALAERLRLLRNHGARKTGGPAREFTEPGFNYRLSEIPAALGLSQMRRIDQILIDRRTTAERYNEALINRPGMWVPVEAPNTTWSYQSFVLVLDDDVDRDNVIARMADKGIETAIGTYACHQHPAFAKWGYQRGDLPNSGRFADSTLTLPIVPRMAQAKVHRVVEALASILECL